MGTLIPDDGSINKLNNHIKKFYFMIIKFNRILVGKKSCEIVHNGTK